MISATEHDGRHARCPLCRNEHCEVRWFHRFPAAELRPDRDPPARWLPEPVGAEARAP